MQTSPRFTCLVVVFTEDDHGTVSSAMITADAADIRHRFAASLAPGTLLMHALAQAGHLTAQEPPPLMDQVLLSRVLTLVQYRLGDETLSVEDLAAELEMSPRHLRRRLHELTGESPQALLRRARVERAEMLLRCGTPSVKEVAHAVGYATTEGLRRAFVAVRGGPPSVIYAT